MRISARRALVAALSLVGASGLAKLLSLLTGVHWAMWEIVTVALAGVILAIVKILGRVIKLGPPADLSWPRDAGEFIDRKMRAALLRLNPAYPRFDRDYGAHMLERNSVLGRPLNLDFPVSPAPEDVYVDLILAPQWLNQALGGVVNEWRGADDAVARGTVWDFLYGRRERGARLVILGGPGSGKTTLLQHVVTSSLGDRLRDGRLPVLLHLGEWGSRIAGASPPSLHDLVEEDHEQSAGAPPPRGWAQRRLKAGRFVVMLDGLDDIPDADDREKVIGWLNKQVTRYRGNHFLITSRPHAYRAGRHWWFKGASVLEAQGLVWEQISLLTHRWLAAVSEPVPRGNREARLADPQKRAEDLLRRLRDNPSLVELAANPLLLTMMIEVDRSPQGRLLETRADLYAEMCRVVLDWHGTSPQAGSASRPSTSESVLQALGFLMMERSEWALGRADAIPLLADRLAMTISPGELSALLGDVSETGLLVYGEGEYRFARRSFQEYFAAAYVAGAVQPGFLTSHVNDPWWRETILLYAALAGPDAIVRACLATPGQIDALTLAFECGYNDKRLDLDLRERLRHLIEDAANPAADPEDRRVAALAVARHELAREIRLTGQARVCSTPVTCRLFGIFRHHRTPDLVARHPADASPGEVETGVTAAEAAEFVEWINRLDDTGTRRYRLPTMAETGDARFWANPAIRGYQVWVSPRDDTPELGLSAEPGAADPYAVTTKDLRDRSKTDDIGPVGQALAAVLALAVAQALAVAGAARGGQVPARQAPRSDPTAWESHADEYRAFGLDLLAADPESSIRRLVQAGIAQATSGQCLQGLIGAAEDGLPRASASEARAFAAHRAYDLVRDLRVMQDYVTGPRISGSLPPRGRPRRVPAAPVSELLTRHLDGALGHGLDLSRGPDGASLLLLDLDLPLCVLFARDPVSAWNKGRARDMIWGPRLSEVVDRHPVRSILPETLRRLAQAGRSRMHGLPWADDEAYIRSRTATVASRIADLVAQVAEREPVERWLASYVRLGALTIAACACRLDGGGEVAQQYVDIAAGITALEQRSGSQSPSSEVIVLVAADHDADAERRLPRRARRVFAGPRRDPAGGLRLRAHGTQECLSALNEGPARECQRRSPRTSPGSSMGWSAASRSESARRPARLRQTGWPGSAHHLAAQYPRQGGQAGQGQQEVRDRVRSRFRDRPRG